MGFSGNWFVRPQLLPFFCQMKAGDVECEERSTINHQHFYQFFYTELRLKQIFDED
jgi:hypothetical protein